MRFSEHFVLNKTQAELDFVDIPLETDMPLFIDPYAISIQPSEWAQECNHLLTSFFALVLHYVQNEEKNNALQLLMNLHEPNSTHLGLSKGNPSGSSISTGLATKLYNSLKYSDAGKTGSLKDLSDMSLMIDNISSDRISDVTTNIIKSKLIEYTQSQCELWGISTSHSNIGACWNEKNYVGNHTITTFQNTTTLRYF